MATNIFDGSGGGNSPMFLNYQPFRLDFSRAFAADERAFMMAAKLQERNDAVRKMAAEMQLPLVEGLENDQTRKLENMAGAMNRYKDFIMSAENPTAAYASPEGRSLLQQYMQESDPTALNQLKKKKLSWDIASDAIAKDPNLGALPAIGPDGEYLIDPSTPGNIMQRTSMLRERNRSPEMDYTSRMGEVDPQNWSNQTYVDTYKEFDESFRISGQTATEYARNGGFEQGRHVPPEAQQSVNLAGALFMMRSRGGRSSNATQLAAAIRSQTLATTDDQVASLVPAYMQTDAYRRHMKNGDFSNGSGGIDPQKVHFYMRNEDSFQLNVTNGFTKEGVIKQKRGSFIDQQIMDRATRWLNTSESSMVEWDQIKGLQESSSNETGKVTQLQAAKLDLGSTGAVAQQGENGSIVIGGSLSDQYGKAVVPLMVATSNQAGDPTMKNHNVQMPTFQPQSYGDFRAMFGLDPNSANLADVQDGSYVDDIGVMKTIGQQELRNDAYVGGTFVPNEFLRNAHIVDVGRNVFMAPGGVFNEGVRSYKNFVRENGQQPTISSGGAWTSSEVDMGGGKKRYESMLLSNDLLTTSNGSLFNTPMAKVTVRLNEKDLKAMRINVPKHADLSSPSASQPMDHYPGLGFIPRPRPAVPAQDRLASDSEFMEVPGDDDRSIEYLRSMGLLREIQSNIVDPDVYHMDVYMPMRPEQATFGPWREFKEWGWPSVGKEVSTDDAGAFPVRMR